jgi:3-oxoisoapionate decarboxylase
MTRRELLLSAAAPLTAGPPATKMGVATTSYMLRRASDPLGFLAYCHSLGAGGVQLSLRGADPKVFRAKAEEYGMWVEAFLSLPADQNAVEGFEQALKLAKECGANAARIVMLGGRRYETFDALEPFQKFAARSWRSLALAEPIAKKYRFQLAIENHKDWRVPEMVAMMKKISSEYVGVLVDTGNSVSLLEEPLATVEAYAPYAMSTHIKDMGVQEYPDGFLLSEVPLGEGFLDMARVFQILGKAKPGLRFTLEMITRDPLQIPCLTPKYWATMPETPARDLAAMLGLVRRNLSKKPLPRVTGLSREQQVEYEDQNVRRCLAYSRETLRV